MALAAAWQGGQVALRHFRRLDLSVEWKPDDSPVTQADREAEQTIHRILAGAFPQDAWLGEESAGRVGSTGRRWIVDPVDGTRNFVHGVPLWATLVACEQHLPDGPAIVAAAVAIPALGELYEASLGGGAYCNGEPIRVSHTAHVADALWCFESKGWFSDNGLGALFDRLSDGTYLQRGLCDAYAHMLIASGRAELMIEPRLKLWDMAAPSLIVQEAGGCFTDLDGQHGPWGIGAVASNGRVHEEAISLIQQERERS